MQSALDLSDADHLSATVYVFCCHVGENLLDAGPDGDADAYRAMKAALTVDRCQALSRVLTSNGVPSTSSAWDALNALEARATALKGEFS